MARRVVPKARTKLLKYVEGILGEVDVGSVLTDVSQTRRYFVTHFANTPIRGATTFMTLGLSEHRLTQPSGSIRQELLFAHYDRFQRVHADELITAVARERLESHRALLHGDVLGPAGPLAEDTEMEALYCCPPMYFDERLHVFEEEGVEPTVFVWLVPIWRQEAEFVRAHGHEQFEDLLEAKDPDLLDVKRASLV
jgi:hypothetical protein